MILCSGAFDGLHAGHIRYLQAACRKRDRHSLVVAIAPDRYIREFKHRAPYWSQADRALTVWALACVDRVIIQRASSVADVIRTEHPSYFVKGEDWRDRLPENVLAACQESGTKIVFVNAPGRHVREAR